MRFRDNERSDWYRPENHRNEYESDRDRYETSNRYGRGNEYEGSYGGRIGSYGSLGSSNFDRDRDYYRNDLRNEGRYEHYNRDRDEDRNWFERTGERIKDTWNDLTGRDRDRDEFDRDIDHYTYRSEYGRRGDVYGPTSRYGLDRGNRFEQDDYGYTNRYNQGRGGSGYGASNYGGRSDYGGRSTYGVSNRGGSPSTFGGSTSGRNYRPRNRWNEEYDY